MFVNNEWVQAGWAGWSKGMDNMSYQMKCRVQISSILINVCVWEFKIPMSCRCVFEFCKFSPHLLCCAGLFTRVYEKQFVHLIMSKWWWIWFEFLKFRDNFFFHSFVIGLLNRVWCFFFLSQRLCFSVVNFTDI